MIIVRVHVLSKPQMDMLCYKSISHIKDLEYKSGKILGHFIQKFHKILLHDLYYMYLNIKPYHKILCNAGVTEKLLIIIAKMIHKLFGFYLSRRNLF